MSLKARLAILASKIPVEERDADPWFPYILTATNFDHVCKTMKVVFRPCPLEDTRSSQHTPYQVRDIRQRHYNYWVDGKLAEPSPDRIRLYDRLGGYSLQDWHEKAFSYVLQYPHRITFDLHTFKLDIYDDYVRDCDHIQYVPEIHCKP